jgi:hypothetical protein
MVAEAEKEKERDPEVFEFGVIPVNDSTRTKKTI